MVLSDHYLIKQLIMEILIKRLNGEAKLPVYSREAGPGIDLYAAGETVLAPGQRVGVATGVAMGMPVGYVGLIWNQNTMVLGESVSVTKAMVDSGYREEIIVELTNNGTEERKIMPGERVAQMLVQKIEKAHLIEAEDLSNFKTGE